MSRLAKDVYRSSSRLLALTPKRFPGNGKMIQPAAPLLGIWRSSYRQGGKVPFVPPTYNELPVPHGSWQKWNQRENEKYNKHLTIGVGFFLFTIFVASQVVTLNFFPPPLPTDVEDLCPPKKPPKCV